MTLGAHILSLRKAKKLSQGDLGKRIGTSGDISECMNAGK